MWNVAANLASRAANLANNLLEPGDDEMEEDTDGQLHHAALGSTAGSQPEPGLNAKPTGPWADSNGYSAQGQAAILPTSSHSGILTALQHDSDSNSYANVNATPYERKEQVQHGPGPVSQQEAPPSHSGPATGFLNPASPHHMNLARGGFNHMFNSLSSATSVLQKVATHVAGGGDEPRGGAPGGKGQLEMLKELLLESGRALEEKQAELDAALTQAAGANQDRATRQRLEQKLQQLQAEAESGQSAVSDRDAFWIHEMEAQRAQVQLLEAQLADLHAKYPVPDMNGADPAHAAKLQTKQLLAAAAATVTHEAELIELRAQLATAQRQAIAAPTLIAGMVPAAYDAELQGLQAQVEGLRAEAQVASGLRSELERAKAEAQAAARLRAELDKAKADAQAAVSLRSELDRAKAEAQEVIPLRAQLAAAQQQADEARAGAGAAAGLRTQLAGMEELRTQLAAAQQQADEARAGAGAAAGLRDQLAGMGELRSQLASAQRELGTARAEASLAAGLQAQLAAAQLELASAQTEAGMSAGLQAQLASVQQELREQTSAALGSAGQAVAGSAQHVHQLQEQVARLSEELAGEREAAEEAEKELEELRGTEVGSLREQLIMLRELFEDERNYTLQARKELLPVQQQLPALQAEHQTQVDKLQGQLVQLQSQLADVSKSNTDAHAHADLAMRDELAALQVERDNIQLEMQAAKAELMVRATALEAAQAQLTAALNEATASRTQLQQVQAQVSQTQDQLQQAKHAQQEAQHTQQQTQQQLQQAEEDAQQTQQKLQQLKQAEQQAQQAQQQAEQQALQAQQQLQLLQQNLQLTGAAEAQLLGLRQELGAAQASVNGLSQQVTGLQYEVEAGRSAAATAQAEAADIRSAAAAAARDRDTFWKTELAAKGVALLEAEARAGSAADVATRRSAEARAAAAAMERLQEELSTAQTQTATQAHALAATHAELDATLSALEAARSAGATGEEVAEAEARAARADAVQMAAEAQRVTGVLRATQGELQAAQTEASTARYQAASLHAQLTALQAQLHELQTRPATAATPAANVGELEGWKARAAAAQAQAEQTAAAMASVRAAEVEARGAAEIAEAEVQRLKLQLARLKDQMMREQDDDESKEAWRVEEEVRVTREALETRAALEREAWAQERARLVAAAENASASAQGARAEAMAKFATQQDSLARLQQDAGSWEGMLADKEREVAVLTDALGDLTAEVEAAERLRLEVRSATGRCAMLSAQLERAQAAAGAAQHVADAAVGREQQATAAARELHTTMRNGVVECDMLRRALDAAMSQVQAMNSENNAHVDKRIVTKLLVTYFERGCPRDVLSLMARMLGMTEDERVHVEKAAGRRGGPGFFSRVAGAPLALVAGAGRVLVGGPPVQQPGPRRDAGGGTDSLADQWVNFLLSQEARQQQVAAAEAMAASGQANPTLISTAPLPTQPSPSPVNTPPAPSHSSPAPASNPFSNPQSMTPPAGPPPLPVSTAQPPPSYYPAPQPPPSFYPAPPAGLPSGPEVAAGSGTMGYSKASFGTGGATGQPPASWAEQERAHRAGPHALQGGGHHMLSPSPGGGGQASPEPSSWQGAHTQDSGNTHPPPTPSLPTHGRAPQHAPFPSYVVQPVFQAQHAAFPIYQGPYQPSGEGLSVPPHFSGQQMAPAPSYVVQQAPQAQQGADAVPWQQSGGWPGVGQGR